MQITPFQSSSPSPSATTLGKASFSLDATRPWIPSAFDPFGSEPDREPLNLSATAVGQDSIDSKPGELKEAFHDFVGQTFFGEMIKAFRTTQQPSKYFHGGRAEEIFQGQFDQVLTEKLSDASAEKIADPMFELFMLKRSS